ALSKRPRGIPFSGIPIISRKATEAFRRRLSGALSAANAVTGIVIQANTNNVLTLMSSPVNGADRDFHFDRPDDHTYPPEAIPSEPNCSWSIIFQLGRPSALFALTCKRPERFCRERLGSCVPRLSEMIRGTVVRLNSFSLLAAWTSLEIL